MIRSILFVCTANICRSPMAEGAFRGILTRHEDAPTVEVDSAGTHDYRTASPPDPLACRAASARGYEVGHLAARRINPADFERFDCIIAMDRRNLAALRAIAPTRFKQKIELLTEYSEKFYGKDIPDPFGKKERDFELALDMIEDSCTALADLVLKSASTSSRRQK